jgi:hypothetical protein
MNSRSTLVALLAVVGLGQVSAAFSQKLDGQWEAYQVASFPDPFPDYAKRCNTNPFVHSRLSLTSADGGDYSGTLIVTAGVQVYGSSGQSVGNVKELAARCRLTGSRKALFARRELRYSISGKASANLSSAKLHARLTQCVGDWCDGGPFKWPAPKDHDRVYHVEGRVLVMDDGVTGLKDDYFHFERVEDYAKRREPGEAVAKRLLQELNDGKYEMAAALFSDRRYNANLGPWFSSVNNDIGGIRSVDVIWSHAMNFSDPSDLNEYMSFILRLGGMGRQTSLVLFVQGPQDKLRITYMNVLGYAYEPDAPDVFAQDDRVIPR